MIHLSTSFHADLNSTHCFDVVDLSEEQFQVFQQCKEEEVSDSSFIESRCDEENEDQTVYPSETIIEDWKQGKEKRNDYKESLKQGNCLFSISFTAKFYHSDLTCLMSF